MLAVAALFALGTACGNPAAGYSGLYSANGTLGYTWTGADGTASGTDPITGNINVFEGASSDLILGVSPSCPLPLNMDDYDTATIVPGTTCTETGNGRTITFTYSGGTVRFDSKIATVTPTQACRPLWKPRTEPCTEGQAHVILKVTDDGTPALTSYRRVILRITG